MITAQILIAARALIEPPGSWCKRLSGIDAFGMNARHPAQAVRRCGLGAVWTICSDDTSRLAEAILAQVAKDRGFGNFPQLNDAPGTTHADVLAAFDEAIERARTDG